MIASIIDCGMAMKDVPESMIAVHDVDGHRSTTTSSSLERRTKCGISSSQ